MDDVVTGRPAPGLCPAPGDIRAKMKPGGACGALVLWRGRGGR